jgi:hypothetical protein
MTSRFLLTAWIIEKINTSRRVSLYCSPTIDFTNSRTLFSALSDVATFVAYFSKELLDFAVEIDVFAFDVSFISVHCIDVVNQLLII